MLPIPEGYGTAYSNAMAAGNPIHIKMEFTNGPTLTDEDIDIAAGVTLTDAFNAENDIRFGRIICRQLTAGIFVTDKTRGMKWTIPFRLYFGVEIEGDETLWINYGMFTGKRPKNASTVQEIEFIAYDQMILFEENADDFLDDLTWSKKVSAIVSAMATELGITIDTTGGLAKPLNRSWSANPFTKNSYTYREVLALICEACGCNARIHPGYPDTVEMTWFPVSTSREVTRDNTFHEEHADIYSGMSWDEFDEYLWNTADTMTWDEVTGYYMAKYNFDGVYVAKINGGNKGRYPTNVKTGRIYKITDNPLMKLTNTSSQITNYVKPLYDTLTTLNGRGWLPITIECVGDLVTQAGDRILIELPEETVNTVIFYRTMRWNGMLTDTYETTAPDYEA